MIRFQHGNLKKSHFRASHWYNDNRICPACTRHFGPRYMLNVHPVNKHVYYGHTKRYSRTNVDMGKQSQNMRSLATKGVPKTCHNITTTSPLSTTIKNGTLPELISNQS